MVSGRVQPAIRLTIKRDLERGENSVQVAHDLFVGEAEHAEAGPPSQFGIAPLVAAGIMRIAINFDSERLGRTEKVHDALTDQCLAAELETMEPAGAKLHPEPPFRLGQVRTHLRGATKQKRPASTTPNPLL